MCQRNDQFLRTIVLIGCVKSVQEGGRGSKIPKILRTYLMDVPLCSKIRTPKRANLENLQLSWKINHQTVEEYIRVTNIDLHWVAQQKGKTINLTGLRKMFSESRMAIPRKGTYYTEITLTEIG